MYENAYLDEISTRHSAENLAARLYGFSSFFSSFIFSYNQRKSLDKGVYKRQRRWISQVKKPKPAFRNCRLSPSGGTKGARCNWFIQHSSRMFAKVLERIATNVFAHLEIWQERMEGCVNLEVSRGAFHEVGWKIVWVSKLSQLWCATTSSPACCGLRSALKLPATACSPLATRHSATLWPQHTECRSLL